MSFSLLNELLPGKRHDRRRRHQRYRADFPLTATVLSEKGYLVLQGRCSDIAEGGMGVILTSAVEPGEVLTVDFRLPHSPQTISIPNSREISRRVCAWTGISQTLHRTTVSDSQLMRFARKC